MSVSLEEVLFRAGHCAPFFSSPLGLPAYLLACRCWRQHCRRGAQADDGALQAPVQVCRECGAHVTLSESKSAVLHCCSDADALRWCLGIAIALQYLHECRPPVIHRDIKVSPADTPLAVMGILA